MGDHSQSGAVVLLCLGLLMTFLLSALAPTSQFYTALVPLTWPTSPGSTLSLRCRLFSALEGAVCCLTLELPHQVTLAYVSPRPHSPGQLQPILQAP